MHSYSEGVRGELAGTGVTVATLCPGPVRTEFLQSAGMDEKKFAAAFPKFLWMPSRDVAKAGVDALEHDRGTVIAGVQNKVSTRLMQLIPRPVLLKLLASQHPALRRDRRSVRLTSATAASSPRPVAPSRYTVCRSCGTSRRR